MATKRRKRGKNRSIEQRIADLEARITELKESVAARRRHKQKAAARRDGPRFSAGWVSSHRGKLRLSAADYGELVGVTGLTIYNWEKGRSRPRPRQLEALAAVRGLGRREALGRLARKKAPRKRARKA